MKTKGHIFLIDDEPELIKFMKWQLEARNYYVNTAISGEEALSQLTDINPDVVIVDIKMPGMNGIEFIKTSNETHPYLQYIVITGHGDISTAIEAMRAGAINYLRKPIGIEELEVAIEKGMEKITLLKELKEEREKLKQANIELTKEKKKLKSANKELLSHKNHLEEILEAEIEYRKKIERGLLRNRIRETLVEAMNLSLRFWEQSTGKTKTDLADESKLWTVSHEVNGPRTRTMDKYLKLTKLPENTRDGNVINTCYFVLKNENKINGEMRSRLKEKLKDLENMVGKA